MDAEKRRFDLHANSRPPHGVKRPADDHLDNASRLSKRFHLLDLNSNGGKLWIDPNQPSDSTDNPPSTGTKLDQMQVEDTKDRVYIHDLEEELAQVSSHEDEERLVFLPDIERRLNNLPTRLLAEDRSNDSAGNELVLYSVPSSLSIPQDQDSVRKAIIETRARAQGHQDPLTDPVSSHDSMLHDASNDRVTSMKELQRNDGDIDEDAMELG